MRNRYPFTHLAAVLVLVLISTAVGAQQRAEDARGASYSPRVIEPSSNFIVKGKVLSIAESSMLIRTDRGEKLRLAIDDQTTVLADSGLVSIADINSLELKPSDLRPVDRVEVVVEKTREGDAARIVTRIVPEPGRMARK